MNEDQEVYFCGCKKSSNQPFCDGTHKDSISFFVFSRENEKLISICFSISLSLLVLSLSTNRTKATAIVDVNGVSIAYTTAGEEGSPSVLMIMGLMASHRVWPEEIVNEFVNAGYRVVLFDNRDTGDSDRLDRLGKPKTVVEIFG